MAVVAVPYQAPWVIARWAFKSLADRTVGYLSSAIDREVVVQSVALDGIHFGVLSSAQRSRIAMAMERAAEELREQYQHGPESIDRDFAERLGDLSLLLSDLVDEGP